MGSEEVRGQRRREAGEKKQPLNPSEHLLLKHDFLIMDRIKTVVRREEASIFMF